MGLDMYLSARRYVGDWNHDSKDSWERKAYRAVTKAVGLPGFRCEGSPHLEVHVSVGYWRKANAIHKWFVDNVQNGEDECKSHHVSREAMQKLLDIVNDVLEHHENAETLLPPQSGFFFGGTEIGEYYWEDLRYTKKLLADLLTDERFKDWEFYYQSSW